VYIIGPTDEDEGYYRECVELRDRLGLKDEVEFLGRRNVMEYYSFLDVVVLTSISEGQPLVILEANASGIPVVATDVGACSELVYGRTKEDRALGPSGIITGVADPVATAEAVVQLWANPQMWKAMSEAGKQRVYRFYRAEEIWGQYRRMYEGYMRMSHGGDRL